MDRRIDLAIRYRHFDPLSENPAELITERFGMYATQQYLQYFPNIKNATLLEETWKNPNLQPITWKQYFLKKNLK
ncbi:MAG: hypothetical protein JKX83_02005 [Pseudomonadales bacterium]|nr:hypothetical protein [Pseudomonadales bacterium]